MNDDTGSISVIATRLPYTDRRALSEAWFSALHLASDGPLPSKSRQRAQAENARRSSPVRAGTATREQPVTHEIAGSPRSRASATVPEPEALVKARVRAAARPFLARVRAYGAFATSLTFGVDGERVALVLRRDGPVLHVVALCRPAVAGIVRRALACADEHLRARGESIRASVTTLAPGDVA